MYDLIGHFYDHVFRDMDVFQFVLMAGHFLIVFILAFLLGRKGERNRLKSREWHVKEVCARILYTDKDVREKPLERVLAEVETGYFQLREKESQASQKLASFQWHDNRQPVAITLALLASAERLLISERSRASEDIKAFIPHPRIERLLPTWQTMLAGLRDDDPLPPTLLFHENGQDLDALLATDLALTHYPPVSSEGQALAQAINEAAVLFRSILRHYGFVLDRPRLLCSVEEASSGFDAKGVEGDLWGSWRMPQAQRIVGSTADRFSDRSTLVVGVEQFGVIEQELIIKSSKLCIYNHSEWSQNSPLLD